MDIFVTIIGGWAETISAHFTSMGKRTYWLFLITSMALAFSLYIRDTGKAWSIAGFGKYLFPKKVWLSWSARIDYGYFIVNAAVMLILFTPAIALIYPKLLSLFMGGFEALSVPALASAPIGIGVLYFIAMIAVVDFMVFFSHYLSHKVPFLWQFHKVHHAAEVLNPMTLYRQHPVDFILAGSLVGLGTAFVHAAFSHIFGAPFSIWTLGSLNIVMLLFYLGGYNLRHSHIHLSYGYLDRWLISPVQHQLHHSSVEAHFDKNMGLVFAIWDRLFQTHYIPAKDEPIILGLPDDEHYDFSSPWACYIQPFKKAFGQYKLATAAMATLLLGLGSTSLASERYIPPSLHLNELTWAEVDQALAAGYDRVIVPTAGTEQNGLHVVLGKHAGVISYTSEQIAAQLGDTLIAPVMDYVPEGQISPPEGHMRFAGTLSLREEVFEMVLEDTAKSLWQHGFTHVYLMGDSGSSIAAQNKVARRLTDDAPDGRYILHVDDYYLAHGQVEWLKSKGYSDEALGSHAGIRDTSELLAAMPEGVRRDQLRQTSQNKGANGAYWKASEKIGEAMLELKIKAALAQIEADGAGEADESYPPVAQLKTP